MGKDKEGAEEVAGLIAVLLMSLADDIISR